MVEKLFQNLTESERRTALEVAQDKGGLQPELLEKDIWIVATLGALFSASFADSLTFKGGTSLSKVWKAIRRFSEDIDVTYDIRAFASDLVSDAGDEALPPTRSQEKRWTKAIRARLAEWIRDEACHVVERGLSDAGFAAKCWVDADCVYVGYEPMFDADDFILPKVIVEFGARSTGEPHELRPVACDAAAFLPHIAFPEARANVMLAERTFWEKTTAAHVFCRQERLRGDRRSRHWHDLVRLDDAGVVAKALNDRSLALSVARHNAAFFKENDARGERIDYQAALTGDLQLVPTGAALELLANDYSRMAASGMLLEEGEPFDDLMKRCAEIEARVNALDSMDR